MFSATPYSTAPFAALRVLDPPIDGVIGESASAAATVSALAVLGSVNAESAVGSDSVLVSSATFSADVAETSNGADTTSALFNVTVFIAESVQGLASGTVEPSVFNAAVVEYVNGLDTIVTTAVLYSSALNGAVAADEIIARYLWELIDDSQPVSWQLINTRD